MCYRTADSRKMEDLEDITVSDLDEWYVAGLIEFNLYHDLIKISNHYDTLARKNKRFLKRVNPGPSKKPLKKVFRIDNFSDEEFENKFTVSKAEFTQLNEALKIPKVMSTEREAGGRSHCHRFSGIEGLSVLLLRLSSMDKWADLTDGCQRSMTTLCRVYYQMVELLDAKFGHLLNFSDTSWLNNHLMQECAEAIRRNGGQPNVVGFIDSVTRPIYKPTDNYQAYYVSHTGQYCVKFQCVTLPNGMIAYFNGAYPGSETDPNILHTSLLEQKLSKFMDLGPNGWYCFYGNQWYGNSKYIVAPFQGNVELVLGEFLQSVGRMRQSTEWGFGVLVDHWKFLETKLKIQLTGCNFEKIYNVAALLTNCVNCLRGNEISRFFKCHPPTLSTYLNSSAVIPRSIAESKDDRAGKVILVKPAVRKRRKATEIEAEQLIEKPKKKRGRKKKIPD